MNIGEFLRRNIVGIVLLSSFSGCSYVVLVPGFQHAVNGARRSACQSNLKAIALACQQYQADNDGRFPPLSSGSSGDWTLLIARYGQPEGFSCPAGYKAAFSPSSDYFFNAQLATKRANVVRDPMSTVAFGDGVDNGPTNSHLSEVPNDWNNEDSPTQRHYSLANYAFADGHIKLVKPQQFSDPSNYYTGQVVMRYKFSPDEAGLRTLPRRESASRSSTKSARK